MELFNKCYQLMLRMLFGFFANYEVDNTTGIHPPIVNAYFQTAFYPFMTMVIRPLGEVLVRLPADSNYVPRQGKLPLRTAGPSFELHVGQLPTHRVAHHNVTQHFTTLPEYLAAFDGLIAETDALIATLPDDYNVFKGTEVVTFHQSLTTISENLWRMKSNFARYWEGEMKAPLPSRDFTNFGGPDAFN